MKQGIILSICLLLCTICLAQTNSNQQIEVFEMPQLFTATLSSDSLVPPKQRKVSRLGDEAIFGFQYGRMLGKHFLIKAGIGFSTRHYSMTKYSIGDIIGDLFLFDSPPQHDSFPISRMQYTLHYFEVPINISYEKANRHAAVQFHYGLMTRLQFLTQSKAAITIDSSSFVSLDHVAQAEKVYANDVNSFVFTIQPYADLSFRLYKGLQLYMRFSPFSFYSSSLNKRISTSQSEFFGVGLGITYHF